MSILIPAAQDARVAGLPATYLDLTEVVSSATIMANGNNGYVRGDMVRRTIIAGLDAAMERPEQREFKHNPVAAILSHRSRYISSALVIVRAYVEAGKPNRPARLASFGDWSDPVRGALMWLGCADPVATMEAARNDDPVVTDLREMLTAWVSCIGTYELTLGEVATRLQDGGTGYQDLRDVAHRLFGHGGGIDTHKMGFWLKKHKDRPVDGKRFVRGAEDDRRGVAKWRVQTL